MSAPQPVMIMVAPNGARGMKHDNAALPISPREIADDVVRCAAAGASIAHLHARNPECRERLPRGKHRAVDVDAAARGFDYGDLEPFASCIFGREAHAEIERQPRK